MWVQCGCGCGCGCSCGSVHTDEAFFVVFPVHFYIFTFLQTDELNRIKNCEGGYVANGRVMGNLAVCRIVMLAGGLCSRMQP